jgi:hypothetical protein
MYTIVPSNDRTKPLEVLESNGDRAVVNVNQHGGSYLESLISFNEIK